MITLCYSYSISEKEVQERSPHDGPDKGKPRESAGRKATDLRQCTTLLMVAGLPKDHEEDMGARSSDGRVRPSFELGERLAKLGQRDRDFSPSPLDEPLRLG
uniref:Uncharacterized protein n=1 Tax=Acetithermum autotrophicum TaxID=1446466 RepID=H5STK2_ACEAU|nr:hypothetical protein HGMM_OP4C493 [Candidatus Acetothermum autotrophicum]